MDQELSSQTCPRYGGGFVNRCSARREAGRPELRLDPLIAALVRYVAALDRRYPAGPDELRRRGLDARSNITRMSGRRRDPAA